MPAKPGTELERENVLLHQVIDTVPDGIIAADRHGAITLVNAAAVRTFGYSQAEAVGLPMNALFPDSEAKGGCRSMVDALSAGSEWSGEVFARRKDGTSFPAHVSLSFSGRRGTPQRTVVIRAQYLTDKQRLLDQLKHLSLTDDLTGVYNARYFWARLRYEFLRARRYKQPLSCLMLDLDHFKSVNDEHGHRAGDDVLRAVAGAIAKGIREVDILARYGGEEFVVILPNTKRSGAEQCAESVRKRVEALSIDINKKRICTTISVGAAMLTANTGDENELLRHADEALMQAKQRGRNRVCSSSQPRPGGAP